MPLLVLHSHKSCIEVITHVPRKLSLMRWWRKEWNTKKNKSKLWKNHDASNGIAAVDKKAHLRMKQRCTVKK